MALEQHWKALDSQWRIQDLPAGQFQYKYSIFLYFPFSDAAGLILSELVAVTGGGVPPITSLTAGMLKQHWIIQILRGGALDWIASYGYDAGEVIYPTNETGFAYRCAVAGHAGTTAPTWGTVLGQTFSDGTVLWETVEKPSDAEVIFQQRVDLEYTLVAILESVFGIPVVSFYFWFSSKEQIATSIPSPVQTIGAEQGYSDPTTGGDYSDLWATILTDWISPIYLLDLAAGDRIHIVQANAGGPYVTKAANIQTQTQSTGSLDVVRDANTGESWVFYADGPSLRCAHERRLVDFPLDSEVDTCLSANSPDRVRAFMSNRILYCVYSVGSFLRLNYSLDAGETWQEMPMLVATNVKLFGATISEDGSSMYLLGKATATDAETNPDDAPEGIIQSGDMVRIVLRRTGENKEWEVTIKEKVTGTLPSGIANLVADIERAGMAFYWFAKKGNDVVLMASDNEMGSFEELDGGE